MAVMSVTCRRIMTVVTALLLLCTTGVFTAPAPASGGGRPPATPFSHVCSKSYVRKEWRTLTLIERFEYLFAVNALMVMPNRTPASIAKSAKNRYDDLVATHIQQTFMVHYVGSFLPFHRYFTWTFEMMLRNEVGYTGPFPYWDWHLDTGKGEQAFLNSPIWDPILGFGGNGPYIQATAEQALGAVPGRSGGGCVQNGAFQNMKVNLGPTNIMDGPSRCLSRDFSFYFSNRYLQKNQTLLTLKAKDFYSFDQVVEGGPSFEASGVHGGGHYGIGGLFGIMGDLYVSPGDPSFWLHHANLDRVWWSWQQLNWPARKTDISGPTAIMDYNNYNVNPPVLQQSPNTTLSAPLNLGYADLASGPVTVGDVMDISNLCYSYDKLYTLTSL
ncbi:Tyrosinase [Arthrobotrys entomopaga]|nr:Tyrosinase [Arthrobotrys entomopaga]